MMGILIFFLINPFVGQFHPTTFNHLWPLALVSLAFKPALFTQIKADNSMDMLLTLRDFLSYFHCFTMANILINWHCSLINFVLFLLFVFSKDVGKYCPTSLPLFLFFPYRTDWFLL